MFHGQMGAGPEGASSRFHMHNAETTRAVYREHATVLLRILGGVLRPVVTDEVCLESPLSLFALLGGWTGVIYGIMFHVRTAVLVTAIPGIKYPIPSELGSQTTTGVVSTAVGDHAGIRRVVTFFFFRFSSFSRHPPPIHPHSLALRRFVLEHTGFPSQNLPW